MKRILITLIAIAGIITGRAQQSIESDSLALLKSELEYVNAKLADVENQKNSWPRRRSGSRYGETDATPCLPTLPRHLLLNMA